MSHLIWNYAACPLTLLHSEWLKLYGVLAILSAIGLLFEITEYLRLS